MMIFLESPWPWLFLGIAVEAVLAVALVRTQRGLLWAMLGVGVSCFSGCWSSGWSSPSGKR